MAEIMISFIRCLEVIKLATHSVLEDLLIHSEI